MQNLTLRTESLIWIHFYRYNQAYRFPQELEQVPVLVGQMQNHEPLS
jgi:hypothetical protein